MQRSTCLAIGLTILVLLTPLAFVLTPVDPPASARQSDHMVPFANVGSLTYDFSAVFAAAAVALIGIGFVIGSFFISTKTEA